VLQQGSGLTSAGPPPSTLDRTQWQPYELWEGRRTVKFATLHTGQVVALTNQGYRIVNR
jgi:hypothetical protein